MQQVMRLNGIEMVKKGTRAKKNPAELRWGNKTPDDLRTEAEDIARHAAVIRDAAELMDELGIKSLRVDGVRKIESGVELLKAYAHNLEAALLKEKYGSH